MPSGSETIFDVRLDLFHGFGKELLIIEREALLAELDRTSALGAMRRAVVCRGTLADRTREAFGLDLAGSLDLTFEVAGSLAYAAGHWTMTGRTKARMSDAAAIAMMAKVKIFTSVRAEELDFSLMSYRLSSSTCLPMWFLIMGGGGWLVCDLWQMTAEMFAEGKRMSELSKCLLKSRVLANGASVRAMRFDEIVHRGQLFLRVRHGGGTEMRWRGGERTAGRESALGGRSQGPIRF